MTDDRRRDALLELQRRLDAAHARHEETMRRAWETYTNATVEIAAKLAALDLPSPRQPPTARDLTTRNSSNRATRRLRSTAAPSPPEESSPRAFSIAQDRGGVFLDLLDAMRAHHHNVTPSISLDDRADHIIWCEGLDPITDTTHAIELVSELTATAHQLIASGGGELIVLLNMGGDLGHSGLEMALAPFGILTGLFDARLPHHTRLLLIDVEPRDHQPADLAATLARLIDDTALRGVCALDSNGMLIREEWVADSSAARPRGDIAAALCTSTAHPHELPPHTLDLSIDPKNATPLELFDALDELFAHRALDGWTHALTSPTWPTWSDMSALQESLRDVLALVGATSAREFKAITWFLQTPTEETYCSAMVRGFMQRLVLAQRSIRGATTIINLIEHDANTPPEELARELFGRRGPLVVL